MTLIAYDNTQGNANHIHSVWQDAARHSLRFLELPQALTTLDRGRASFRSRSGD